MAKMNKSEGGPNSGLDYPLPSRDSSPQSNVNLSVPKVKSGGIDPISGAPLGNDTPVSNECNSFVKGDGFSGGKMVGRGEGHRSKVSYG